MSDASTSVLRISVGALGLSLIFACAGPTPRPPSTRQVLPGNQLVGAAPPAPIQLSADTPQADVDVAMRKRGYQPATFRGERVYCRSEPLTGSNLQTRVCRTAKEIEDQERAGKEVLNGNRPAGCLPRTGCN
jgi:hypothetical protein